MSLPDAPREAVTERNGAFSYATEIHAFVLGLTLGLSIRSPADLEAASQLVFVVLGAAKAKRSYNAKALRELKREPWYFGGGLVIGLIAGRLLKGGRPWFRGL